MFLIIGFQPGDSVSIAGQHFSIDERQLALLDDQGHRHQLSDAFVSPMPEVRVRVAETQRWPGRLSLAFEGPRGIRIVRLPVGDFL